MEARLLLKLAGRTFGPTTKQDRAPSFLGPVCIRFAGTVIVVAAMHEVHERTGQQNEVGQDECNMRQVIDQEIDAESCSGEANE